MKQKHTHGPLTVSIEDKFPFDIVTKNKDGEVVFVDRMPSNSTSHKTAKEAIRGKGMPADWNAREHNERAIADAVLRAAAPEMLEILEQLIDLDFGANGWSDTLERIAVQARAVTKKARGNHD